MSPRSSGTLLGRQPLNSFCYFRINKTECSLPSTHVRMFLLALVCFIFRIILQDCVFTKNFTDTALHVAWTGALRVYACAECCKRWYFTLNGAECSTPLPIDGVVYLGSSGKTQNPHRVRHIEGHCNNIHKGKVRLGFWVGNCARYGHGNVKTGWNSVSRIFIEEVPTAQA